VWSADWANAGEAMPATMSVAAAAIFNLLVMAHLPGTTRKRMLLVPTVQEMRSASPKLIEEIRTDRSRKTRCCRQIVTLVRAVFVAELPNEPIERLFESGTFSLAIRDNLRNAGPPTRQPLITSDAAKWRCDDMNKLYTCFASNVGDLPK
jgi:hypothetical protein